MRFIHACLYGNEAERTKAGVVVGERLVDSSRLMFVNNNLSGFQVSLIPSQWKQAGGMLCTTELNAEETQP